MEYRITLAVDRCTTLAFRFLAASWWKIHLHVAELLSVVFARFHVHLCIPWVSLYKGVLKSPRFVLSLPYQWNLIFFVVRHVTESLLHEEETSLNISGKEVDLARNLFHKQRIYHQKSINVQQSFLLGRRATLYYEGLINVNRNLHKAIYLSAEIGDIRSWLA